MHRINVTLSADYVSSAIVTNANVINYGYNAIVPLLGQYSDGNSNRIISPHTQ